METEQAVAPEIVQEKKEEKPNQPVRVASLIPVSPESGVVAPTDHTQLIRLIDQLIVAKAIPKHLENREQVLAAWNFAAQLKLPPQPSLRNIAVIEGTPSLFGELPLALAQNHPDYMWHDEFVFNDKYEKICFENKNLNEPIFGGVFCLQRKGMEKPQSFSFTIEDAKRAGIYKLKSKAGNDTIWAKYPQVMIVRRARSMGLKSKFADALTGAAIAEYDFNLAPDIIDVTPTESPSRAKSLNEKIRSNNTEPLTESEKVS